MDYIIYLLVNDSNQYTYIGITNNPERRIRQHNREISGGARYTKMKKEDGVWKYYGFILGCNKNEELSIKNSHLFT